MVIDDKFGWLRMARLGPAQAAQGAVVVLNPSTLKRVMVLELAMLALLPGVLVALHHLALAVLAFTGIGLGVSASGTSQLVLLAKRVQPERRAGAATLVGLMMIVGFAVTAGVAGRLLDPYSPEHLLAVTCNPQQTLETST